jgi:hypothetical protein
MPGANSNGFDAEEFAKLMASFDTGNPSEAEAMNAGRLMRRLLVSNGLRLVDAMGRADVMAALDARLQPMREESPEVKGLENKVTELADELAREKEITEELRGEIDDLLATAHEVAANQIIIPPRASDGLVNGGLVAAVSIVAVTLMIAAAFH